MYSDTLQNQHFCSLASVIRMPFQSRSWRKTHATVPFWKLLDSLNKVKTPQVFATNPGEFVARFCKLLIALVAADGELGYTEADLLWFLETMDSEHALTVISLLLAYASAPEV